MRSDSSLISDSVAYDTGEAIRRSLATMSLALSASAHNDIVGVWGLKFKSIEAGVHTVLQGGAASGSSASSSGALAISAMPMGAPDDIIPVSRVRLQAIMDCIARAETSARQATMISSSASAAFQAECAALSAAKADLERMMRP